MQVRDNSMRKNPLFPQLVGSMLIAILLPVLALAVSGCTLAPASFSMPAELEGKAPWRGDIYFLEHELPHYHKNAYHTLGKAGYEEKLSKLKQRIEQLEEDYGYADGDGDTGAAAESDSSESPYSSYAAGEFSMLEAKIYFELRKFTASIGDAHTAYSVPMTYAYPFNLQMLDDGVFVTAAAAGTVSINESTEADFDYRHLARKPPAEAEESGSANGSPAAAQLTHINGMPVFSDTEDDVFSMMLPGISRDNEAYAREQLSSMLLDPVTLIGCGVLEGSLDAAVSDGACSMTFKLPSGEIEDYSAVYPVSLRQTDSSGSPFRNLDWRLYYSDSYTSGSPEEQQQYEDDRKNLPSYLQYSDVPYRAEYYPGKAALYILYNRCRNAEDESFEAFIKRIIWDPIRPVDTLIVDLRNNSGGNSRTITPLYTALRKHPMLQQTRVRVITGPRTFSSALMNVVELYQEFDAEVFGAPTGGKPNHYGEVKQVRLPSGNTVSFSTQFFRLLPGDHSDAFFPSGAVRVPMASDDFFSLRDPVLEAALGNRH